MLKSLALVLTLAGLGPVWAESPAVIATWGENSGSLPPEYAWDVMVEFKADRHVTVTHCVGYAQEAPGCAVVDAVLSKRKMAELTTLLDEAQEDLVLHPPRPDPDPPIGGDSSYGSVNYGNNEIDLPAFPIAADAERVSRLLSGLRALAPGWALNQAEARAVRD